MWGWHARCKFEICIFTLLFITITWRISDWQIFSWRREGRQFSPIKPQRVSFTPDTVIARRVLDLNGSF
jgi:hypothetical protein